MIWEIALGEKDERQREAKNESEVVQGQIMRGWCVSYRVWIQPQCLGNQ